MIQVPSPLSFDGLLAPVPNTENFLYQEDQTTIIAQGLISLLISKYFNGIHILPTHIIIDITKVFVPAAIVTTHHKQLLSAFGSPPFSLVCLKSCLKSYVSGFLEVDIDCGISTNILNLPVSGKLLPVISDALAMADDSDTHLLGASANMEVVNISFYNDAFNAACSDISTADGAFNPNGVDALKTILKELEDLPWPEEICSGVLKDIFHVFQMIWISKSHGLQVTFAQILCDAIFLPDLEDKWCIISFLA